MNLFEALKVNGKAIKGSCCKFVYFIENGFLYFFDGEIEIKSTITANEALSDDWIPYKKPCKHEPMGRMYLAQVICKHCLLPLEPTGWREINSGNADNKTK